MDIEYREFVRHAGKYLKVGSEYRLLGRGEDILVKVEAYKAPIIGKKDEAPRKMYEVYPASGCNCNLKYGNTLCPIHAGKK